MDKGKREVDELKCLGHILNSLTNRLYKLYRNLMTPKKNLATLEVKCINMKEKGMQKSEH